MVFIRIMNIMVFRTLESMSVIFYWSDIALFLKFLICKIWSSDSKWFLCIWKMWIFVSSTINILLSLTVLFMLYYCSSIPYIFSIYTFQLFSELFLVLSYRSPTDIGLINISAHIIFEKTKIRCCWVQVVKVYHVSFSDHFPYVIGTE